MKISVKVLLVMVAGLAIYTFWPSTTQEAVPRLTDANTIRETSSGPIIGSADANNTYAWLGIPFATPPVGDARWRAPRAVELWTDTQETIAFRDPCVQLSGPLDGLPDDSGRVVGSEDCLYLNVWSPSSQQDVGAKQRPVMLWLHGGGNTIGTANTYPGSKLAGGEEIVLVTINYRLGFFGWMSHPALRGAERDLLDASGNYANLDMIAALTWVRDNIANFGGDPENVTIFGESAGGLNVYQLMASPLAKGLFHKAISQSGSVATTPRWRAENYQDAAQPGQKLSSSEWLVLQLQNAGRAADPMAARVVLDSMSDQQIQTFMYSRSADQILEGIDAGAGMYPAPQGIRDGTVLPEETLYSVFANPENYNSVPLITGSNRDEAKLFMAQSPDFVERRFGILPRIKNELAYNSMAAYISDNWKAMAVDGVANIITANTSNPVFAYRWDWDEGSNSMLVDYSTLLGAAHGLEVAYVFDDFDGGIIAPGLYNQDNSPGRDVLAAQMRSYWSEFARTGKPGKGREGVLPTWQSWNTGQPNLMLLDTAADDGLRMVEQPMTTNMLKLRLAEDAGIPTLLARCTLHVQLFLQANAGADVWSEAEYKALGCSAFPPWLLEVSR